MLNVLKIKNLIIGLITFLMLVLFNCLVLFTLDGIGDIFKVAIMVSLFSVVILLSVIYFDFQRNIKLLLEQTSNNQNSKAIVCQNNSDELTDKSKTMLLQQHYYMLATIGDISMKVFTQWRQYLNIITVSVSIIKVKQELGISVSKDDLYAMSDNVVDTTNTMADIISSFNSMLVDFDKQRTFQVADCIDNVLSITRGLLKDLHINVITEIEDIELVGLKSGLTQIILNILINSMEKFKNNDPINRTLTIKAYKDKNSVLIQIKDNTGIVNDSTMGEIFECTNNILSNEMEIYMCIEILKVHFDGQILHEHRLDDDGIGSCYTIEIPSKDNKDKYNGCCSLQK